MYFRNSPLRLLFLLLSLFINYAVYAQDNNSSTAACDPTTGKKDFLDKFNTDVLFYGDFGFKNTNFLKNDYNSIAGWSELRVVFKSDCLAVINDNKYARLFVPNPYFKLTFAGSGAAGFPYYGEDQTPYHQAGRIGWESYLNYGGGLENRFIERLDNLCFGNTLNKSPCFDWVRSLRFYGEHLESDYWAEKTGQPEYDDRFGVDLWYEWNVPGGAGWPYNKKQEDRNEFDEIVKWNQLTVNNPLQGLWGEIWLNGDWRSTNFSTNDYDGYSFGSAAKFGVRACNLQMRKDYSVHVMPYVLAETSRSEKNEFYWENRLLTGGGLRIMPKIKLSEKRDLLLKIYAEHVTVVDYFEKNPNPNTPWNDTRVGINFSVSRH